ncbi:hypothetical protein [Rummeliibacillus stabekisii]|uniref:Uncharacterized protein n=1 Tax=Rummeliibacillus stabekisii TaxID=241244 RepID=A0A143HI56_9BACL|nr:hypothetical protein [Rummeliibacillus stabekisii]AMX01171.1 hypothetical protein ATY39_17255 [Rummeliibacillus stabekisii]
MMDKKAVLALRIGSDATAKTFVKAKDLIMHMALRMKEGYTYDNVVAAFTQGLNSMEYKPVKTLTVPKEVPVFARYNWLKN